MLRSWCRIVACRTSVSMIDSHPTLLNGRKHSGPTGRQRRDRRFGVIVGVMLVLGFGASILALTVGLATSRHSPGVSGQKSAASGFDNRTGSIIDTTNRQCRQAFFDNDSGRVSDAGKSCRDGTDPLRTGTERRLDAISKSFLNN
jgi:hypothetical protein